MVTRIRNLLVVLGIIYLAGYAVYKYVEGHNLEAQARAFDSGTDWRGRKL